MHVVNVKGIEKHFGSVHALRGLTVDVPSGAVGLLGPNGAGKSTLLKILLGLLPADGGEAFVLELDVAHEPMEVRRRVGYMPEVDAYLPGITGAESVLFAGVMCGMTRRQAQQRAHEILYYVGLADARYRKVDGYSTGMRQRLRMAQALVHDPQLIFLDEPTNGLDPQGRDEVLTLIRDLADNHGKSIVLCSHLLHDVEAVCKHVVLLREGRIALAGPIEEVRRLEQGLWRLRVTGDLDAFRTELERRGIELVQAVGESMHVRLAEGGAPELFSAAHAAGCSLREMSTSHQSLTGVFIQAVEGTSAL